MTTVKDDEVVFVVGYDESQRDAFEVCCESLRVFLPDEQIIATSPVLYEGVYNRPRHPNQSTDFAFTRFLTPWIAHNYTNGFKKAVFCDSDFLWLRNPLDILEYANDKQPVQVVKHKLHPENMKATKMNGKPQTFYPMKNWSSLMMFDIEKCAAILTPELVEKAEPSYLHQFEWLDKDWARCPYSRLPYTFNYLVGYGYDAFVPNPHAVHFTDGGPWHGPEYANVEYAKNWIAVRSYLDYNRYGKCTTSA